MIGNFAREYELTIEAIFPGHYSCKVVFPVYIVKSPS